METKRRNISLSKKLDDNILKLMEVEGTNRSSLVEKAMLFYIKHHGEEEKEMKEVLTSINKNLNTLKLIANSSDKDTKILVELWNHYWHLEDLGVLQEFADTENDEMVTDEYKEAKKIIETRISKSRQRKLDAQI